MLVSYKAAFRIVPPTICWGDALCDDSKKGGHTPSDWLKQIFTTARQIIKVLTRVDNAKCKEFLQSHLIFLIFNFFQFLYQIHYPVDV